LFSKIENGKAALFSEPPCHLNCIRFDTHILLYFAGCVNVFCLLKEAFHFLHKFCGFFAKFSRICITLFKKFHCNFKNLLKLNSIFLNFEDYFFYLCKFLLVIDRLITLKKL